MQAARIAFLRSSTFQRSTATATAAAQTRSRIQQIAHLSCRRPSSPRSSGTLPSLQLHLQRRAMSGSDSNSNSNKRPREDQEDSEDWKSQPPYVLEDPKKPKKALFKGCCHCHDVTFEIYVDKPKGSHFCQSVDPDPSPCIHADDRDLLRTVATPVRSSMDRPCIVSLLVALRFCPC
jgi:hypothetical protein